MVTVDSCETYGLGETLFDIICSRIDDNITLLCSKLLKVQREDGIEEPYTG